VVKGVPEQGDIIKLSLDPRMGHEQHFNAEIIAAFKEGDDMISGKIPVKWNTSLDDLDEMLGL